MYTRYTCIYTIYTPNTPPNTPYTPYIHPLYTPYIHHPQHTFWKGEGYFEIDVDIHRFNYMTCSTLYGWLNRFHLFVVDWCFVIEGRSEEELPVGEIIHLIKWLGSNLCIINTPPIISGTDTDTHTQHMFSPWIPPFSGDINLFPYNRSSHLRVLGSSILHSPRPTGSRGLRSRRATRIG